MSEISRINQTSELAVGLNAEVSGQRVNLVPLAPPAALNALTGPALGQRVDISLDVHLGLSGSRIAPAPGPPAPSPVYPAAFSSQFEDNRDNPIFPSVINRDQIEAGRELYHSAKNAGQSNPNLTPIALSGGRVALMPNNGGVLSPETIQKYIKDGADIYESIQNGQFDNCRPGQNPPIVGEKEITNLMWYLQALAASKAAISVGREPHEAMEFKSGGMLIEDSNGKLKNYLDLANSYDRRADYFPQGHRKDGTQARGVDVFNSSAPYGARSLLYQKLPSGLPQANFLYVKLEPFGYRGLSFKTTGYSAMTINADPTLKPAPGAIKRFFLNLEETLRRVFSSHKSEAALNGRGDNSLKAPKWLVEDYSSFVSELKNNRYFQSDSTQGIIKRLKQAEINYANFQSDSTQGITKRLKQAEINYPIRGVQAAFSAIEAAIESAKSLLYNEPRLKMLFLSSLYQFKSNFLSRVGDYPNLRFGGEAILTENETGPIAPRLASEPSLNNPALLNQEIRNSVVISEIEKHANQCLSAQGESRERLLNAFNHDFDGLARLRVFNSSAGDGDGLVYDADGHNIEAASDLLVPSPAMNAQVSEALVPLGLSPQFSSALMSLMNRKAQADLIALANYNLVTQTGLTVEDLGFSLAMDYRLTKLTAPDGSGEPDRYALEVAARGVKRPGAAGEGVFEGEMEYKIRYILTPSNIATEPASAAVEAASLNFNITRTWPEEA
ncbi:MAG: hypothetical protein LBV23_05640 [Deltaproteobacteria bacterium]|jgi:hypothetical protein|nr:hypothetical protein [Deltaproteobacteria bacterium]